MIKFHDKQGRTCNVTYVLNYLFFHRYGSVDKKILLSNLDCTGEEDSLLGCHRELNFRLYSPGDNAGVQCTNDTNYKSGEWLTVDKLPFSHPFLHLHPKQFFPINNRVSRLQ